MADASGAPVLPPLYADRHLSDSLRCGSCRKSDWLDNYSKLHCRPRGHIVSPVKNYCAWHRFGEQADTEQTRSIEAPAKGDSNGES